MSKKFIVPSETGAKGIPKGVGSSKAPRGGFVVPSEVGKKGKPGKAGFPGGPAARD